MVFSQMSKGWGIEGIMAFLQAYAIKDLGRIPLAIKLPHSFVMGKSVSSGVCCVL